MDTHIITVIDYFTKWVEAIPLTQETHKQISMFILNYIIYRYGIPHYIIIDNRGQLKNKGLYSLCSKFNITQYWSSIYFL